MERIHRPPGLERAGRLLDNGTAATRRSFFESTTMIAVIGNVIAGLLAVSLFTATLRISK
jgi:hypothetical protein